MEMRSQSAATESFERAAKPETPLLFGFAGDRGYALGKRNEIEQNPFGLLERHVHIGNFLFRIRFIVARLIGFGRRLGFGQVVGPRGRRWQARQVRLLERDFVNFVFGLVPRLALLFARLKALLVFLLFLEPRFLVQRNALVRHQFLVQRDVLLQIAEVPVGGDARLGTLAHLRQDWLNAVELFILRALNGVPGERIFQRGLAHFGIIVERRQDKVGNDSLQLR